jgi:hypothetical protein
MNIQVFDMFGVEGLHGNFVFGQSNPFTLMEPFGHCLIIGAVLVGAGGGGGVVVLGGGVVVLGGVLSPGGLPVSLGVVVAGSEVTVGGVPVNALSGGGPPD